MVPNDTALASFARDFGDSAMSVMMTTFYESSLVKLTIYISAVCMFVILGLSLHRGTFPKFVLIFWVSWLSILPVKQKPALYVVINTFSELTSELLYKFSFNMLTAFGTKKAIPPGFVYNAIHRAAFSEITDPILKDNVRFLVDNCVPTAQNKEGKMIGVADLFGVKVFFSNNSGINPTESLEYNFDPNLLKVRTFDYRGDQINCFDFLNTTLYGIRSHLRGKQLTRQENNPNEVQVTGGEQSSDFAKMNQVALNLAQASSINKQIVNDYFPDASKSRLDTIDGSVAASTSNANYLTGVSLTMMNTPKAIARSLNIDGVIDNASRLNEINEKILNLPYYTSYLQTILKIIAPLAIISIFLGTFRWIKYWALGWCLSLTLPWFLYISRIISNSILMWSLKLNEISPAQKYSSGYLLQGVNFEAASKMLEDSSRMMSVFLQCELALWGSLFIIVPFSTWMAGQAASNWIGRLGSTATGTLGGTAARMGAEKVIQSSVSKVGTKLGSLAGPLGIAAGAVAGSTLASSTVDLSNQKNSQGLTDEKNNSQPLS